MPSPALRHRHLPLETLSRGEARALLNACNSTNACVRNRALLAVLYRATDGYRVTSSRDPARTIARETGAAGRARESIR
jgi:hypothetical protein